MADQSSRKTSTVKVNFKLDSGASDHLAGETLETKSSGIITGYSNRGTPLPMEDVLLVSEWRDNLMSVKKHVSAAHR